MSDLQISLLAIGACVVAGVYAFNLWQERQFRRRNWRSWRTLNRYTPATTTAPITRRLICRSLMASGCDFGKL